MAVMDEFREEREAIKNAPFREKAEYYWEYYRTPVFITLAIIACVVSIIVSIASRPNYVLNGYLLNRYWFTEEGRDCDPFAEEYLTYRGYDTDKYEMELNGSLTYDPDDEEMADITYQTAQLIGTRCAAGDLDFMVADIDTIRVFDEADYYYDLREVYSEEELKAYEERLIYATNDSSMPIAIDITDSQKIQSMYGMQHEQLVITFFGTAEHMEEGKMFVEYILQNE